MPGNSIHDARAHLLERVHTEGVLVAYETALAVCRDPKAPAPAKATAAATLFRVAGYFDRKDAAEPDREPHEMTADELGRAIAEMERRIKRSTSESVFD